METDSTRWWRFFVDGSVLDSLGPDPVWEATYGESARYGGEVYGLESDMAGTQSDPCTISDCQLKRNGQSYQYTTFNSGSVKRDTTDGNEWWIWYPDDVTLRVYDKNPK